MMRIFERYEGTRRNQDARGIRLLAIAVRVLDERPAYGREDERDMWPTTITPTAVMLAFGFAGVVGVFFGFYPARKTALLNPIEALRYE